MTQTLSRERTDLLDSLANQWHNLLITMRGLTDEQAATRSTVSELTLGGILNHLINCERGWTRLMLEGGDWPEGMLDPDQYRMPEGATLDGLLAEYAEVNRATADAVTTVDLDKEIALPRAPWSPPETIYWSARRIIQHILKEIAQHSGHADIIREYLDGANTTMQMGA
ncbi:DinB family protein [Saccharopolyspora taberi]